MSGKEKVKKNQSFSEDCFQDLSACDWKVKLPCLSSDTFLLLII